MALRERLIALERHKSAPIANELNERTILQLKTDNTNLRNEINNLKSITDAGIMNSLRGNLKSIEQRNFELEQEKSNLTAELRNQKNEYEAKLNIALGENEQLKIQLGQTLTAQRTSEIGSTPTRLYDQPNRNIG